MSALRTILFDQSSSCIGFAVIQNGQLVSANGKEGHGIILPSKQTLKTPERLQEMMQDVGTLLSIFKPHEMVLEWHHYHGMANWQAIESTAASAMICRTQANKFDVPVYRVRQQRWKAAIGAKGQKDKIKHIVRRIVSQHWSIPENKIKSDDHSDVLGMAATWAVLADDLRQEWLDSMRKKKR